MNAIAELERVGTGANADVFAWGQGCVLKRYRRPEDLPHVREEFARTQAVWQAGLPAPEPIAVEVDADGLPGIVMERVDGPMLMADMMTDATGTVRTLARLMHAVHAVPPAAFAHLGLHTATDSLRWRIRHQDTLTAAETAAALRLVDALPEKNCLCHSDLHPLNVMRGPRGPVIIDWEGICVGHPAFDILSLDVILQYAVIPAYTGDGVGALFAAQRQAMHEALLDECLRLYPTSPAELDAWVAPVAAARLHSTIPEEEKLVLAGVVRARI